MYVHAANVMLTVARFYATTPTLIRILKLPLVRERAAYAHALVRIAVLDGLLTQTLGTRLKGGVVSHLINEVRFSYSSSQ